MSDLRWAGLAVAVGCVIGLIVLIRLSPGLRRATRASRPTPRADFGDNPQALSLTTKKARPGHSPPTGPKNVSPDIGGRYSVTKVTVSLEPQTRYPPFCVACDGLRQSAEAHRSVRSGRCRTIKAELEVEPDCANHLPQYH
jgi:hypothetical protein